MARHEKVRNFCIIAHIDHGKSTLADRFLEVTSTLEKREMKHNQMLDTMDLEQERGITIKLQPVRMEWKGHQLNLIDTPGHVDFTYEVSRSLAAVEGAILVVDATQGVQAQTIANMFLALEHNLTIIPVLNKIDLPQSEPERRMAEIEHVFGIPREEVIMVSAKDGTNVDALLDAVIERIPAPEKTEATEMKALIFDSVFDTYRGVVIYVKVMQGEMKRGDMVYMLHNGMKLEILEVGCFRPKYEAKDALREGEIGYVVTGFKTVRDAQVGDTVWRNMKSSQLSPDAQPLPGYKKVTPFVYASLYCVDGDEYPLLRDALEKLVLNDSSLEFEPEVSSALGNGFRCGFLGLLHMEIVQERLEREYDLNLIVTAPSVPYEVVLHNKTVMTIHSPADLPDPSAIDVIREPFVKVEVLCPKDYLGSIMELLQEKRGEYKNTNFIEETRVVVHYEVPLSEIIIDFYDKLKSISSGYASLNYEFLGYRPEELVKLDIVIAEERIESLAMIVHKDSAYRIGLEMTKKLKELIPKAQFVIPIQAAIGGRILARETISAMRKDVTGYLYGGDVSRKRKLLEKQKEGKKRMKQFGKVSIPQEAFLAVLKRT